MNQPALSPGQSARRLLRSADRAYLATRRRGDAEAPDWPYAALVLLAVDHDASPLLLISALAEHTKDIAADDRVALLVDGTQGLDEPLTGARATVLGRIEKTGEPRHRQRFLARHPGASIYADFKDFGFFRVVVEHAHLVAGFGRIHWIDRNELLGSMGDSAELVAAESEIVQHMNRDHADALSLYAAKLLGLSSGAWAMTGIDAEGLDLRLAGRVARLDFPRRVATAEQARAELARLAKQARAT